MLLGDTVWFEIAAGAGLAACGAWLAQRWFYLAVPPHKALVLYGRRSRRTADPPPAVSSDVVTRAPRIVVGGGAVLAPWNKAFAYLSLAPVDVETTVRALHTIHDGNAAGWEVSLTVQAKIPVEPAALRAAAENLIGLTDEDLRGFVRRAVESAVPPVLARLDIAGGEPDWERLAAEIQATVAPDLIPSGLVVRSVSVRELRRIAQPSVRATAVEPARRSVSPLIPPPGASPEVDYRLARIERGLRAMSAQVGRWLRERPAESVEPSPAFDIALGRVLDADGIRSGLPYDSMEEGGSSRSRRPVPTTPAEDGRDPANLSDSETSR